MFVIFNSFFFKTKTFFAISNLICIRESSGLVIKNNRKYLGKASGQNHKTTGGKTPQKHVQIYALSKDVQLPAKSR